MLNNNCSASYCRKRLEVDDVDTGNWALYFNYVRRYHGKYKGLKIIINKLI